MGVPRIRSIEAMKRLYSERHIYPLESEKRKAETSLGDEKRKVLEGVYKELMEYALANYPMLRPKDICSYKRGDYNVESNGFGLSLIVADAEYWDTVPNVKDAIDNLNRAKRDVDGMIHRIANWEYDATFAVANRKDVPEFKG